MYNGRVTVAGPADVHELGGLSISKLAVGPFNNNTYLLRCRATGRQVLIDAARQGHGIARVLSYQVAEDVKRGALVRILRDFERAPIPVHLVFPSARLMAPRVRAFLDFAVPRLGALDCVAATGSSPPASTPRWTPVDISTSARATAR